MVFKLIRVIFLTILCVCIVQPSPAATKFPARVAVLGKSLKHLSGLNRFNLRAGCIVSSKGNTFGHIQKNRFYLLSGSLKKKLTRKYGKVFSSRLKKTSLQCKKMPSTQSVFPLPTQTPGAVIDEDDSRMCTSDPDRFSMRAPQVISNIEESAEYFKEQRCVRLNAQMNQSIQGCASRFKVISQSGASNGKVLQFKGDILSREARQQYHINLPTEVGKEYILHFKFKTLRRACYNYLGYQDYRSPGSSARTLGIWCGAMKLILKTGQRTNGALVTQPQRWDAPYINAGTTPFLTESIRFKAFESTLAYLELDGLDATMQFEFALEEVTDGSDLEDLTTPILHSYKGMDILSAPAKGSSIPCAEKKLNIVTNGGVFSFGGRNADDIVVTKDGTEINRLRFSPGMLDGLTIVETPEAVPGPGLVLLRNEKIFFSLGSDGVLVIRVLESAASNTSVLVTGDPSFGSNPKNFYQTFEVGTLFQARLDSTRTGFFFSPVYLPEMLRNLPVEVYPTGKISDNHGDTSYVESVYRSLGRDQYTVQSPFRSSLFESQSMGANGAVSYQLSPHAQFVVSLLSMRDRDDKAICSNRIATTGCYNPVSTTNQTSCPVMKDLTAHLNIVNSSTNKLNAVFLNMAKYSTSNNTEYPTEYYVARSDCAECALGYKDVVTAPPANGVSSCEQQTPAFRGVCSKPLLSRIDAMGPWNVAAADKPRLLNYIAQNHALGTKVFIYMSPQFALTSTPMDLVAQIIRLKNEFGIDGVYFDGTYAANPLKTLQLMRETRNILGVNDIIMLHSSVDNQFLPRSDHYFFPGIMMHASMRALGEGVKKEWGLKVKGAAQGVCDPTWGLHYAGRYSVPSYLFPELRSIDSSKWNSRLAEAENLAERLALFESMSMLPTDQVEAQLSCGGAIYAPMAGTQSSFTFIEKFFGNLGLSQNTQNYWNRLNQICS